MEVFHLKHLLYFNACILSDLLVTSLDRTFADFELHFLVFNHTKQTTGYPKKHTDTAGHIIEPLLTQMADVSVAVEADFFLGHLKSPEAEVVNMLQRSRGDGGVDFHSVDAGSSWQGF